MSIPKETSAPVAKSASAKKMLMGDLMQTVGILPILILIVAVFGFIAPNFFTESNLLNITRQASINIVLAAGMTFIILTGGIAHSRYVTDYLTQKVGFIAPVEVMAGEFEMEALAAGASRVLAGQETPHRFRDLLKGE